MVEIFSPTEFAARCNADESWQLLDVREPWEIEIASVPQSIKIPMAEIPSRHTELDADKPVAVLCHSGGRSAKVADFLATQGFSRVANIDGGIDAWAQELDDSLARY
ncbi:MAG: rhodanese-like domain-containing protein [Lysobacterales bacterium]